MSPENKKISLFAVYIIISILIFIAFYTTDSITINGTTIDFIKGNSKYSFIATAVTMICSSLIIRNCYTLGVWIKTQINDLNKK